MLYRVIVRIGYTGDDGTVTTAMRAHLQNLGLENTRTGTWESASVELGEIGECLSDVLTDLSELDDHGGPCLKHLWIYIDGPYPDEDAADVLLGPE